MLDADAVINNSFQKVGRSNAYPDPAPKKWVGAYPEKHVGSKPLSIWSNKAYLSAITVRNIFSKFYLQDGGKNQLA